MEGGSLRSAGSDGLSQVARTGKAGIAGADPESTTRLVVGVTGWVNRKNRLDSTSEVGSKVRGT